MGTGMIATGSIAPRTGNVSSGTSANLTVILEKPLASYYEEIDVIATPDGYPAALIHANNCTTEINEWVALFDEVLSLFGTKVKKGELFDKLFDASRLPNRSALASYWQATYCRRARASPRVRPLPYPPRVHRQGSCS